ncbi:BTB/POZ domain-containing family protein [Hibiscus syriacus]|uniref:BTB/POZ domain-containing family protein n=1 Tax=Hibiscus syriacus TaxID=106335 RepID=A0A6A3CJV7_HIBSY|nr:BTB/POZ domain-containing family protein [Hibiscus syriacus]
MKLTWNKKKNNKKRSIEAIASYPNLPFDGQQPSADNTQFQNQEPAASQNQEKPSADALDSDFKLLAQSFQDQGNKLAEDGKYREALGKWEAALNLMPENAVLFEQKAQVLLELGDAWSALKAASRMSRFLFTWLFLSDIAWVTLGRAQLHFGEPDNAIESFDRALAIKPDSVDAQNDKKTALHLIKRRKQLHSSGLSTDKNRYLVGDSTDSS